MGEYIYINSMLNILKKRSEKMTDIVVVSRHDILRKFAQSTSFEYCPKDKETGERMPSKSYTCKRASQEHQDILSERLKNKDPYNYIQTRRGFGWSKYMLVELEWIESIAGEYIVHSYDYVAGRHKRPKEIDQDIQELQDKLGIETEEQTY